MTGRSYTSSADQRYKFTGKERDASTGLDYFGARYYDSWRGQWAQVDPHYSLYPSLSPYNYTGNNPLLFIDRKGMDSTEYQNQNNNTSSYSSIRDWLSNKMENIGSQLNKFFSTITENEGQTSAEQKRDEIINNHGLTNKQIAEIKLHTMNTGIGILSSAETTAAGTGFNVASMGSEGFTTTLLFDFASALTGALNNYVNGYSSGNYNFTSSYISLPITGASLFINNPMLKAGLDIISTGTGIGLSSFNYSQQEWNLVNNPLNY
ncbi:MAG TPA: RHS repeat-associated core domain-containing protein [Ignavibacteriaceae bacterium]|nr:RHS repeat-associated core domain-containing protein [Ignavibacteriaceae bacterium]